VAQAARPRRVLVTGGASGIGLAVVRAFAEEGDFVVSLDLTESSAASESVIGDVRESKSHEQAVATASKGEGLDVLVVNAGIHDGGLGLHSDVDELLAGLHSVLDIDVIGYVLALRAAAEDLATAKGTAILTLSDASFLAGQTGAGIAYTAAKHAQVGILMWAARALAPTVRVNGVAPGGVITGLRAIDKDGSKPLFADAESKRELVASRNPLGTVLEPEEVAQLFVWLASTAARGMTGQIIRPDGGLALR
jgi:2,3-dihydroxy-2,3-dihydrophenylpropionate dehydrogenase